MNSIPISISIPQKSKLNNNTNINTQIFQIQYQAQYNTKVSRYFAISRQYQKRSSRYRAFMVRVKKTGHILNIPKIRYVFSSYVPLRLSRGSKKIVSKCFFIVPIVAKGLDFTAHWRTALPMVLTIYECFLRKVDQNCIAY